MDGDSQQRLARLRHLAPERDGEILRAMNAREVEKTASQFLNYMAVDKWDAGAKGNYNIERNGKDLKIISKADGRGVVFERKNGQILNNLSSKDVTHFRDLNNTLEKRLSKVVGLQVEQSNKQSQLTQSQPKVKKEKELSL
ncbi:MAG: hypothetical protein HC820_09290 [Hydrococcus sp. RM1_1_31]|nr:hypothetical protein [Hydrococcus sp. RM1_1_31]